MMLRPALLLVATTLLAAGSARAEDSPAVPPAGPPLSTYPTIPSSHSEPASAPESPPRQPLPLQDRTHAFMMPTGNVLRAGEAAIRNHGFLVYNQLAYGLSDNVELSAGAAIVPLVANAGIRAQLMPRSSSLRLLATGGLWTVLDDVEPASAFNSSATLAYQSSSLNLHVTLGALWPLDADRDDEDMVLLTSTGMVLGSDRYAFFIEVGRVGPPGSHEAIPGAMLGFKLMGKYLEIDLGIIAGSVEQDYLGFLPFLSSTYRF